jgi:glycine betaine/proline transport system substrate-binding protein
VADCDGGGDSGETLEIADIGWTENTAISALTKVLLEEELGGYQEVTVHTRDLDSVYEDVAQGDLDAFEDVWLPNQQDLSAASKMRSSYSDPGTRGKPNKA